MLACLACFVWLLHKALHPISTIVLTPTIDVYSGLLPPSPLAPTCLLPFTFAITAYSYLFVPAYLLPLAFAIVTYFCHYHLFKYLTFFYLLHRLLSPSPPFLTCLHHHRLFPSTSTIATYLFSPSPPTPTYFHHCHLPVFAIAAYSHLLPSLSPL
jgi:hypothetical protein